MKRDRLKLVLSVLSSVILYGGIGLGLLMMVVGVAMALGLETGRAHWGVSAGAGLVVAFQALLIGGALKLLVGIDDRLERLERRS